jgi:Flp pilus assembly protein TadD
MTSSNPNSGTTITPRKSTGTGSASLLDLANRLLSGGNAVAIGILLLALVAGTYLPSLDNGFTNLDDPSYVFSNAHVQRGLTWQGTRWAFSTTELGLWHPLTWLSLMLDAQLSGPSPFGFHLTNLVFHAANTLLLFLLLRRITAAPWRSAFVAALFALHPIHVESVAWVAERKDVLSTFFFLLTLLAYAAYASRVSQGSGDPDAAARQTAILPPLVADRQAGEGRGEGNLAGRSPTRRATLLYTLALGFFVLGLMSKTMVVTLPIALLLLDFWPLKRLDVSTFGGFKASAIRLAFEKLPFFVLSLLFGIITLWSQRGAGSFMTDTQLPIQHRFANALLSYIHYLVQMVWPGHYAVFYPYPRGFSPVAVALALLLLAAASVTALLASRKRPYVTVGWLWYLLMLLPVIGLVQVGSQSHADRYTYVPLLGIFILLTWRACDATRWLRSYQPFVLSAAGAGAILLCIPLTLQQIGYWKNSEVLARHALQVAPNNPVAHNILGIALMKRGQLDEAIMHFQAAAGLASRYAMAEGNLGAAFFRKGDYDESIKHSRQAIKLQPDFAGAYGNLGAALGAKGQVDEAIVHLREAVKLAPDDAETRGNLGFAFMTKGQFDDAIAQYQQAARLLPGNPAVQTALQAALSAKASAARH